MERTGERPAATTPPAPQPGEAPSDLGFGSVVAGESRQRLLNRDGTFFVDVRGISEIEPA